MQNVEVDGVSVWHLPAHMDELNTLVLRKIVGDNGVSCIRARTNGGGVSEGCRSGKSVQ